jgi:hypothetical protein
MLDREFNYFRDQQKQLVSKYRGRYIVIVGEKVVGDFATEVEAYAEAKKRYGLGAFLIQHCIPGKGAYQQTHNSRINFVSR